MYNVSNAYAHRIEECIAMYKKYSKGRSTHARNGCELTPHALSAWRITWQSGYTPIHLDHIVLHMVLTVNSWRCMLQ